MCSSITSFKQFWEENSLKKIIKGVTFEIKDSKLYIDNDIIYFKSYDILEIIGGGANAIVLKGKENISNRICAIKVWFSKNKETGLLDIEKHKKEIEKISKFDDDLIVKYYSTDMVNNYVYCTMEYIEGQTLRRFLNRNHPSLSFRYKIMMDIIKALRIAHSNDIYHGDLHDRNILVSKSGKIKVLDFGTSFGKKDYSMSRDSRLMYKLGKTIMGNYYYKDLIWMNKSNPQELSPKTMRLILESMSKIIVLLNFLNDGVTENVIEDLALFTTLVPFYNLNYITSIILEKSNNYEKEKNLKFFEKQVEKNIIKRLEVYNLIDLLNRKAVDIKFIYKKINELFIEKTTKYDEKYIYYDEREVELFKSNLYSDYIKIDSDDTKLDIINKALNKYN